MMRLIRTGLRPRNRERRGQAVILMYHSISRGRPDPWSLCVDPDLFAQQVELLHDHYRVVSLGELGSALARSDLLPRTVALTFDDGYRDNLFVAKPTLEKYGVPATVFVTTSYTSSGRDFWWDELEAFCATAGVDSRGLWEDLRALAHEQRAERLDALWASIGVSRPEPSLPLSPTELEHLADGGLIALGAHTVTHPHLSSLAVPAQRHEIEASKAHLAEVVGRPVEDFSYPHGDFSQATVELVKSAGFETACTTRSTPVTRKTGRFQLPRLQVGNWDGPALERELESRLL